MEVDITLELRNYIAHPYSPALEKVISITRDSGQNRARTAENRQKALAQHLASIGMEPAEFEQLKARAEEEWIIDARTRRIVITPHQVLGMMAQAAKLAKGGNRIATRDTIRSLCMTSRWYTDRTDPDGVWSRFAVVTAGTGAKLSNQRALRENEFIGINQGTGDGEPVTVTGHLSIPEDWANKVTTFLAYCGRDIGIGASRNMGWGRFRVVSVEVVASNIAEFEQAQG